MIYTMIQTRKMKEWKKKKNHDTHIVTCILKLIPNKWKLMILLLRKL